MSSQGTIRINSFDLKWNGFFKGYYYKDKYYDPYSIMRDYYSNLGFNLYSDNKFWFKLTKLLFWECIYHSKLTLNDWVIYNNIIFDIYHKTIYNPNSNHENIMDLIKSFKTDNKKFRKEFNKSLKFLLINSHTIKSYDVQEFIYNNEKVTYGFIESFFKKVDNESLKDFDEFFYDNYGLNFDFNQKIVSQLLKYDIRISGFLELCDVFFKDYFNDKFNKFLLTTDFKIEVYEQYNTVKRIFDNISDKNLILIFERIILLNDAHLFPKNTFFKENELILVEVIDICNPNLKYEEFLWYDFLLNLGFNFEIFAIGQSQHKLTRIKNFFHEKEVKLEVIKAEFVFDEDEFNENLILNSVSKVKLKSFNELKNEFELLESMYQEEDLIIKINDKAVDFEDISDVYYCCLEKNNKEKSKDYCALNNSFDYSKYPCMLFSNKDLGLERFIIDDRNLGYFNESYIWISNQENIKAEFEHITDTLKFCPYFDFRTIKKKFKIPKKINAHLQNHWNFVDNKGHSWYYYNKIWFNEEESLDFPGFKNIVGVEKTNYEIKHKVREKVFETLKKNKRTKKFKKEKNTLKSDDSKTQTTLFDF